MATTKILLKEDIDNLGGRGEIVKVKSGYARNYLLPQGFAILATKGNIRQVEQERKILLKKAAEEKSTAEAQLAQMEKLSLRFERLAGESGTLFGSVTSMDIAEALEEKGYEIDRRKITLKSPIKEIGDYTVPVKLHREVVLDLPVAVVVEGEAMKEHLEEEPAIAEKAPEEAAAPEKEEASTEAAPEASTEEE
ncbi:MAG: 50S ribosomal protein L9 [Acidobacteriota bacterium]|nr:MAG: 50S ribosomal protein L9 [Acidobacteriota bacterium]